MDKTGIICVSLLNTPYSLTRFCNDKNSIEIIASSITDHFPNCQVIHYFDHHSDVKHFEKYFKTNVAISPDIYSLLSHAKENFKGCETVAVIHTDEPLTDFALLKELIQLHTDNIADYTMGENYPSGVCPFIISYDTLAKITLIASGNNEPYHRGAFFRFINMDINSYDLEVSICEKDMRRDRLDLRTDTLRNFLICENIFIESGISYSIQNIIALLAKKPALMRTLPAYIEIEITGECDLSCVMCPRTKSGRNNVRMPLGDFKKIIDDINANCPDTVVCLSGMGEPFLHPDIIPMIEYVIRQENLRLIVETSGVHFTKENADKILAVYNNKLHIIFSLEAIHAEDYKRIRGADVFQTVEQNIDYYISRQTENTFIQFVKMESTEQNLDAFYERWKNYEERIILIKYNDYRGEYPDNKIIDLSPVKRFPCWHLKRDMYINALGDAVLCKQDYKGTMKMGNVLNEGVKNCFNRIQDFYVKDYLKGPDEYCKSCDEYYTYNF